MMKKDTSAVASASESEPSLHYLAIHVGSFVTDNAYNWGHDSQTNIGRFNAGLTYRVSEWSNSIDVNVRVDYLTYQLDLGRASQLVFLPLITFPDVTSKFPLYFGVGAGAGVFFNQIQNQSSLSLDYQLIAGVRFFNLWQNVGAFVESGLKNHVHLTSTGQFNGTFLSVGSNFTF